MIRKSQIIQQICLISAGSLFIKVPQRMEYSDFNFKLFSLTEIYPSAKFLGGPLTPSPLN